MKSILADKAAFATPLLLYAYKEIGEDIFELEPETIEQILRGHGNKVLKCNIDKINAALGLLTTNLFWQDPVTFAITCRTLNRATRVAAAPPDIEDVVWAVTEARLITGDPNQPAEEFSDSIKAYVAHLLKLAGIVTPVPTLDFIPAIREASSYDDSEQQLANFSASQDRVDDLEQGVSTKMVTMLKQIKDLHIDISKEAAADIESLLQGK